MGCIVLVLLLIFFIFGLFPMVSSQFSTEHKIFGAIMSIILGIPLFYSIKQWAKEPTSEELRVQEKHERSEELGKIRTLQDAYDRTPQEFEGLVQLLFERMGYEARTTQTVGDGGIDLWLHKDGTAEIVQCKKYQGNVSVQVVREFFGVMIDKQVNKGYIITTGHFTLPARTFAEGKSIHLIDGTELAELLSSQ